MTYILQPLIGEWTAWDDETRAEAEQVGMLPRLTVIWWCSGLHDATSAALSAPVSENEGGVGSGATGVLVGPQIEEMGNA